MRLLAIDTSAEACSAALYLDGEVVERYAVQPQRQSELILPMMDELLAAAGLVVADLDALAFARGPGSFTGVRIATGVVQGAAFASDLPVVPVSTLAAVAQGCLRESGHTRVLAALDARMNEVYWAACAPDPAGVMRAIGDELIVPPSQVPLPGGGGWHGAGSGWDSYGTLLAERLGDAVTGVRAGAQCHARDVAAIAAVDLAAGRVVPAERAIPVYLRDQVAWKRQG